MLCRHACAIATLCNHAVQSRCAMPIGNRVHRTGPDRRLRGPAKPPIIKGCPAGAATGRTQGRRRGGNGRDIHPRHRLLSPAQLEARRRGIWHFLRARTHPARRRRPRGRWFGRGGRAVASHRPLHLAPAQVKRRRNTDRSAPGERRNPLLRTETRTMEGECSKPLAVPLAAQ